MPLLSLLALLPALCFADQSAPDSVAIDGRFRDWADIPAAAEDPLDAPDAPIDITTVRITHDEHFVHVFANLTRDVCIQQMDGMLHMVLDVDGDEDTGLELHGLKGADIVVTLSPVNQSHGKVRHMGVGLTSLTYRPTVQQLEQPNVPAISPYDIGFTFAPTYANNKFEFRLVRGAALPQTPITFADNSFRLVLVHTDYDGNVLDTTDVMEHALTTALQTKAIEPVATRIDPLARLHPNHLRVMSLNTEHAKLLQEDERAGRIIRSLAPDVLLLQELTDRTRPDEIESLLNRHAPPAKGRWHVLIGEGGGNLRCGVATHLPFEPVSELKVVSYPHQPDRHVREAAMLVEYDGRHVLAMSIHLRCCGGATGEEEESRCTEVAQIRSAIDPLRDRLRFDGVVIGGDCNLVGTREPLNILCRLGDMDKTDLAVADAYQLDGRSNATWSDFTQPFVPGRLDYVVFSDSSLANPYSFVFDSADLPQEWLEHHGLQVEDSMLLSDHRPVVLDLAWTRRQSSVPNEASAAPATPSGAR